VAWVVSVILLVAIVVVVAILGRQITTLQRELRAARSTHPEVAGPQPTADPQAAPAPTPADPAHVDGRLPSLWALTLLEQQRQWHLTMAATAAPGPGAPDNLPGALDIEVERIREEVGTPGTLTVTLSPTTTDDDAIVFHATRQLLALLVPHTQAFDLILERVDDQAVLELTCTGWEGPDQVAEGVGRLLEAVAPAGGDLELDMLPGDRLQATLRLPLDRGASASGQGGHRGHLTPGDP
jgi:hypothetical protein